MLLATTSQTIQAFIEAAATTTNPVATADWQDLTASGTVSGTTPGVSDTALSGTTAVAIVASPAANTYRTVKNISIFNGDTVSHAVTVQFNDGTNARTLVSQNIAPGLTLEYTDGEGWQIAGPGPGINVTLGKTLTVDNSLELAGADGTKMTFPSGSTTVAGLGTAQTFAAPQTFADGITVSGGAAPSNASSAQFIASGLSGSSSASATGANRYLVTAFVHGFLSNSNGTPITAVIGIAIKDGSTTVASKNISFIVPTGFSNWLGTTLTFILAQPAANAFTFTLSDNESDGGAHTWVDISQSVSVSAMQLG